MAIMTRAAANSQVRPGAWRWSTLQRNGHCDLKPCLSSALPIDFFDAWAFVFDIFVNILGIQLCRLPLYPAVFLHGLRMGAQIIAEGEMALEFL